MSVKDQMPSREWLRQKIEADPDLSAEARSASEECVEFRTLTLEEAIEIGRSDNEANWDNPVRLEAYRIRQAIRALKAMP